MQRTALGPTISQVVLCAYLEVVEWADLFPWNDVRHGNGQPVLDVVLGIIILCAIAVTWRTWRVGMGVATLFYALWLGLQVETFWLPYLRGASPGWQRVYAANFAQTLQWLPRNGTHLPPDANHIVLQALLAITFVALCASTFRAMHTD